MLNDVRIFNGKTIVVTGAAGNIGSAICLRILQDATDVKLIGIDSLLPNYDINIKYDRLDAINHLANRQYVTMPKSDEEKCWLFFNESTENNIAIDNIFTSFRPNYVVHLATMAPPATDEMKENIGLENIMKACLLLNEQKEKSEINEKGYEGIEHLFYADDEYRVEEYLQKYPLPATAIQ